MASRFWVGGTGNWSDNTTHWSDTSGGTGGASLPTSADSVYFDANSFTATGQVVTVDATANCLDMDWTGATNNPIFSFPSFVGMYVYGKLTLILNMSISGTYGGNFTFKSTSSGNTIITAGKSLYTMTFNGVGGTWTLQDDPVIGTGGIILTAGYLKTNDKSINCASFNAYGTTTRGLELGNSIITCSISWRSDTITNLTFDAGTSTIKLTGNTKTFYGGSLTYNNVEFQGTPTTITGSNTFNQLKVDAAKVAKLTAGTTQTVTTLSIDGATIQSATAGSAATITTPNDDIVVRTATIQDITATKPIYALKNSVNVSGNTNITFTSAVFRGNVGAVKCTTTGRPTTNLLIGMQYYDTTLNKPIWYKGSSVWVDATGTIV